MQQKFLKTPAYIRAPNEENLVLRTLESRLVSNSDTHLFQYLWNLSIKNVSVTL
jgi:hypothetical protein